MAAVKIIYVFLAFVSFSSCQSTYKDVVIEQGTVRGYNVEDDDVFSFYGIPYATAPTGEDRFKEPLAPPTWTDTFNATINNEACPQAPDEDRQIVMDCLKLYILVPNTEQTNLPVYVFVHGGAFQFGTGAIETPVQLTKRGMIVVRINYRLGIYGFLCLGTEYAPGNAGMKDQVAALRWVKRNIANFGGDPDNITLGGSSAGSFAAELLVLSPVTAGLFSKAIIESGSALAHDAFTTSPVEIAEKYANQQGLYMNYNVQALENYYRSLTDEQLNIEFIMDHRNGGFIPCLESHNFTGVEKFLERTPYDILSSGEYEKRPILTGFTLMEGLTFAINFEEDKVEMQRNFTDFLPKDLVFESAEHQNEISERVKQYYFPTGEITTIGQIEFYSDAVFTYPQSLTAKMFAEGSNSVYYYFFTYNGSLNFPVVNYSPIRGPGHAVQLLYVQESRIPGMYDNMTEDDYITQERLRSMWYNFARYSNPIPTRTDLMDVEWTPLDPELDNYLEINVELTMGQGHPLHERLAFWHEIYRRSPDLPDSAASLTINVAFILVAVIRIFIY